MESTPVRTAGGEECLSRTPYVRQTGIWAVIHPRSAATAPPTLSPSDAARELLGWSRQGAQSLRFSWAGQENCLGPILGLGAAGGCRGRGSSGPFYNISAVQTQCKLEPSAPALSKGDANLLLISLPGRPQALRSPGSCCGGGEGGTQGEAGWVVGGCGRGRGSPCLVCVCSGVLLRRVDGVSLCTWRRGRFGRRSRGLVPGLVRLLMGKRDVGAFLGVWGRPFELSPHKGTLVTRKPLPEGQGES